MIAVGVNCTHPDYISPLLKTLGKVHKPIITKPNSGEKWDPVKRWVSVVVMHCRGEGGGEAFTYERFL